MTHRIMLGAVGRTTFKALVLSDDALPPNVSLVQGALVVPSAPLVELPVSPQLRPHLRGIRVYLAQFAGLVEDSSYEVAGSFVAEDPLPAVRTLGNGDALKVLVASCYFDGFAMAPNYAATLKELARGVHFKLLIGDNLYLDVHARQRDPSLAGGYTETGYLYTQQLFHSQYRRVWTLLPTFTTWDDHEFWNNYPEWQCHLERSKGGAAAEYAAAGLECLELFQAALNPGYPLAGVAPAAAIDLSYRIDDSPLVSFFVADTRSQRQRHAAGAKMMPPAALASLEQWATTLKRPGVLVIGQPLWIDAGGKTDFNPPAFADEYRRIWQALADAPYDVLVVSGDVHHSRVLRTVLPGDRFVYEFVTSPACHIPTVTSIALGSYDSQDRGSVEAPDKVQVATGQAGVLQPRLDRYYFGTDVPNSIASLEFVRGANGSVQVGCAFWDCTARPTRPAPAIPGRFGKTEWQPDQHAVLCRNDGLFDLVKRSPIP